MDFSKKQFAIMYLERDKGSLYMPESDKPFVVAFPKNVISNLEITDKSTFEQLFSEVISSNELKPINVLVVLSKDILFEKTLEDVPLSLQSVETEKFLDIVPFHQIISKTYNVGKKTLIVAANRDFLENVNLAFSHDSFSVTGVVPITILEEKFPHLKEDFDVKFLIKKAENLKQYFLPMNLENSERIITYEVPSFKNVQFIALISVFVLLLIIMGIELYVQIIRPSMQPRQVAQPVVVKKVIAPTSTPTPTPERIFVSPAPAVSPVVSPIQQ